MDFSTTSPTENISVSCGTTGTAAEGVESHMRCVDFLRDNEDELDFRSLYGTPVLQTDFPELEKSGATQYTREIFFRNRETLKSIVVISIIERKEMPGMDV
ncbi:hypothetical protein PIB30_017430 [Stylosanthes scabra]|uniref:Uncharacterized protein n=1 Tax=Stylosanthes scabra TaxID=79078 RepID=A0ABU6X5V9_9FABA|nr:hypothetical protein [Stylosanthes scabra]